MLQNKRPLELNPDFKYALDELEKGQNMFITGRAGTGKSTLLKLFRNTTRKNTVVVAPTGIAALNVGGQTIHSFFGFPPKLLAKEDIKRRKYRKLYEKLEILIVDEISMVRADMLDNMDYFLQINRNNPEPFGGVQVVFFGDLFQLPPVVSSKAEAELFKTHYESPYFFSAQVFKDGFEMENLELRKTYRQESRHFIRLLDAIRVNQLDFDDLEDLNERYISDFDPEENYITLSARNATVNKINMEKLLKLTSEPKHYRGSVSGVFNTNLYPTAMDMNLKIGAQVMFIKNDPQKQYVNGTIGRVIRMEKDFVRVEIRDPKGDIKHIDVKQVDWEITKYKIDPTKGDKIETEVVGTFTHFPLKLAWAITIHKSQGKTFDRIIIDLGRGAFEHGQTYVALSRCRTLEGIVLKQKIRPRDIMVDPRIVEFFETYF